MSSRSPIRTVVAFFVRTHFARGIGAMLGPVIVVDGYVVGSWKRTIRRDSVVIETFPFTPLNTAESDGLAAAAAKYGEFLGMPVVLS